MPLAAAEPIVTVSYTPEGVVLGETERYYLRASAGPPEPPRPGNPYEDDCSAEWRPADPKESAMRVVESLREFDPSSGTFSDWFPDCVALTVAHDGPQRSYASYNVSSGRYYVEPPAWIPAAGPAPRASSGYSGTTGAEVEADCVGCPPPTCC